MDRDRFVTLSKRGEGATIEYKTCAEQISESLYETVCSFLNHNGGKILVGVRDSGEIVGVNSEKAETLKANIITAIKNPELFLPCPYFTPRIIEIDGKTVIYLDIPCGQYVYRYKGRYWDRNGDADIDITDRPELMLAVFERKNPHLFEERTAKDLTMSHLDHDTFRFCRNILAATQPEHAWLQLSDEDILVHTRLAKRDTETGVLKLKYAALILFGTDEAIADFMPRYRFEAMFHLCTYEQYNDERQFPNRYDDRRTMRSNLIKIYNALVQFTERWLPDKFYLPTGTTRRVDLRLELFREIIANLCVHADYSAGYACFYHVFKDRVITKNPTRLLPEIPEGRLTLQQLSNYTKNPLLVRVFHELSWVEDMGSGTRNILRYAPLYYQDYKVEINSGTQFIFSITYAKVSQEIDNHAPRNGEMSQEMENHAPRNGEMSQETNVNYNEDDLRISLEEGTTGRGKIAMKKQKRQQGIIGLIRQNPGITIEEMAERLAVNERTVKRDIEELRNVIAHIGPTKGGTWVIIKK